MSAPSDLRLSAADAVVRREPATERPRADRIDGWTADRQRAFLTAIAEGHTVEAACRLVGMTHQSAYALRNRASGASFALGWQAATLLARNRIADVLIARALDGQTDTYTRDDGSTVTRHRHDNRLATAMLTRLDRLADAMTNEGTHHAARLVAQEFDAFLDLIDRDEGPARAGLFLGLRVAAEAADADLAPIVALARADRLCRTGVALAGEVPIGDLDPAARADWTAEQWQRAEAAGLIALAPPAPDPAESDGNPQLPQLRKAAGRPDARENDDDDDDDDDFDFYDEEATEEMGGYSVRWCSERNCYRTDFPPPPGFDGEEEGDFGDELYERDLTDEETAVHLARRAHDRAEQVAHGRAAAEAYFRSDFAADGAGGEGAAGTPAR